MTEQLIKNLQNAELYNHPIDHFKVIETHISWVLLTGKFAYKIKKPVDFKFLDFSTLEKRKFYCEQELRLNQQLAPEIYLDVIPIRNNANAPQLQGDGPIFEYALKMREFSQENLFNQLLAKGVLSVSHIDQVARILANFHLNANRACPPQYGTAQQVHEPVVQNFDQIRPFLSDSNAIAQLNRLKEWADTQHRQHHTLLQQRKDLGFIRECHGDIHLGNITLLDGKPVIFDCIEFNEPFRWTDVMADLGFLVMDLHEHQLPHYVNHLINNYIQITGDYQGLQILPYYQAYRAMVRAKVAVFGRDQTNDPQKKAMLMDRYLRFTSLAESYTQPAQPFLLITHGLSGTGKSTLARNISENYGAIQLRSDVERKRITGLKASEPSHSQLLEGIYSDATTQQTYQRLAEIAKLILQANFSVVIDATFLKREQRKLFEKLAASLQIPFIILHSYIAPELALNRIKKRREKISEATPEVLNMQQEAIEPLTAEELEHTITVDTTQTSLQHQMIKALRQKLKEYA